MAQPGTHGPWPLKLFQTERHKLEKPDVALSYDADSKSFVVLHQSQALLTGSNDHSYLCVKATRVYLALWSHNQSCKVRLQGSKAEIYWCNIEFMNLLHPGEFIGLLRTMTDGSLRESIKWAAEMDIIFTSSPSAQQDAKTLPHKSLELQPQAQIENLPNPQAIESTNTMECLKRLWRTGEWSDLVVVSEFREFHTHKAVLCTKSTFFAGACRHAFWEAKSGKIMLEEEERIVQAMLEFMYGAEISLFRPVLETFAIQCESDKIELLKDVVALYTAADKYDIPGLKDRMTTAFHERIEWIQEPTTITTIAELIYENTLDNDQGIRQSISTIAQNTLPSIMADKKSSAALVENHSLVHDLLQHFAGVVGQQSCAVESKGSNRSKSPSPERKRKSPRTSGRRVAN